MLMDLFVLFRSHCFTQIKPSESMVRMWVLLRKIYYVDAPLLNISTKAGSLPIPWQSCYVMLLFPQYQMRCCIYHGPDTMCSVVNSGQYEPKEGLIVFNETISFKDLDLVNIPRMARLCFMFNRSKNKATQGGKKGKDMMQVRKGYHLVKNKWIFMEGFCV